MVRWLAVGNGWWVAVVGGWGLVGSWWCIVVGGADGWLSVVCGWVVGCCWLLLRWHGFWVLLLFRFRDS